MESIELNSYDYEQVQGTNDLEMIDNISKRRKAKLEKKIKAGKFSGKKLKRKQGIVAGTRLTTFGKIAGVATGGASLAASKAGRVQLKKAAKKAGDITKGVAGATVLLPLVPLRPMMIKALNKEGIVATKRTSTVDLANRFYKNIVRKGNPSFEEIDLNNIESYDDNVIGTAIAAVVSGIIAFVKGIKKRKASGEKLNATDELIEAGVAAIESGIAAKEGETVTDEPVDVDGTNNPIENLGAKMGVSPMVIYAAIVIIIIVVIMVIVRRKK
ncbi:MAG: hypothetical protein WC069_06900 [Candidatus Shapirobacteria bacterium]